MSVSPAGSECYARWRNTKKIIINETKWRSYQVQTDRDVLVIETPYLRPCFIWPRLRIAGWQRLYNKTLQSRPMRVKVHTDLVQNAPKTKNNIHVDFSYEEIYNTNFDFFSAYLVRCKPTLSFLHAEKQADTIEASIAVHTRTWWIQGWILSRRLAVGIWVT